MARGASILSPYSQIGAAKKCTLCVHFLLCGRKERVNASGMCFCWILDRVEFIEFDGGDLVAYFLDLS